MIIAYGQIIPAGLLPIVAVRVDQSARFPAAEISRGGADQLGDREWRTKTGLTTMRIDAGMDTGEMLLQEEMEIDAARKRRRSWRCGCRKAGAPLMLETLRGLDGG